MQPTDILEKTIEADKNLATNSSEGNTELVTFTPSYNKPKLRFSQIKKVLLKGIQKGEYEKLKGDISLYKLDKDYLGKFFSEEGHIILNWAVAKAPSSGALDFLYKEIPIETLKNVLSHEDFSILETFLMVQSGFEELNWQNEENENSNLEKFKLLLKIDPEGVQKFIKSDAGKPYMSESITRNFENAVGKYKESSPLLS